MPDDVSIPRQDGPAGSRDSVRPGDATDTTREGASVVSWGDPPATGGRAGLALHRLGRDSRLVPVIGAAGAAAVFASLIGDWAVTSMPVEAAENAITLGSGVADMKAFGTAYLVGVVGVNGCLALVLFGSPGIRHNARVAGLAGVVALLGILLATTGSLETVSSRWELYGQLDGLVVEYGQGLVLAYVGTCGLGLALLLAGRFVRRGAVDAALAADPAAPAGPVPAEESDWPWRRPRAAGAAEVSDEDDDDRQPPIDLTVAPTKPFAH